MASTGPIFLEQRLHTVLRGDINLLVAVGPANADNLMLAAQFFRNRAANGTAGANNDNFSSQTPQ